ncbi:pectate lyase family protein [Massilia niabensis]|uniref:Polysaccharide lyase family 1 protein n=1 Tax=Massilia niabensis TaxID=544910 RepID=A0ABW0L0U1_9BURK
MRFALRVAVLTMACWCLHAPAAEPFKELRGMSRAGIDVKGWADTKGGAGGRIVRVTNLNASGEGSFAAAVAETGPRIVVFEVGGVIDLQGKSIRISEPHLTIAGQTAPNPGITFIRGGFALATHDVIVQHIAVRPGEFGRAKRSGWEADGLSISAGDNVIIDHCSFSWATDENLSASGPRFNGATPEAWRQATSRRITFSHNIVSEGLRDSTHKKGEHSKGTLIHDNANRVLIYGNLYNANHERNPLIKGGAHVAVVNNLIHDFGARAIHYNLISHEWGARAPQPGVVTLVGNVARGGADTLPGVPLFSLGGAGDVSLYLRDNLAVDANGKPLPQTGSYTASGARILKAGTPDMPPGLKPIPSARLENAIYISAGMRPWARDPVDFKVLSDVAEGRGLIVDSEAQSSGYPAYAPTRRDFDPSAWNLADMSPKAGWDSLFPRPDQ